MAKCPICEYEDSKSVSKDCTQCGWDLIVYPLNPDGLKQEQDTRVEWGRQRWKEIQKYKSLFESSCQVRKRLNILRNLFDLIKLSSSRNRIHLLQEADILTGDLIYINYGLNEKWQKQDFERLNTTLLLEIDEIWRSYTYRYPRFYSCEEHNYGFYKQIEIWYESGQNWKTFISKVNWMDYNYSGIFHVSSEVSGKFPTMKWCFNDTNTKFWKEDVMKKGEERFKELVKKLEKFA